MRLVSWNVRDLTGDPRAVRAVLRDLAPDVLCLQEAPRRPGGGWRLGALARAVGLRHVAGGRSSGGTALLVAPHVVVHEVQAVRLPVPRRHHRTRGAVVTRLTSGPVTAALATVHLPLTAPQRLDHAERVRGLLEPHARAVGGAVVVAGDFNEPAASPAWGVFAALASDPRPDAGPTFPARGPWSRLDAVLVGPALRVVTYEHPDAAALVRASDHVPVVVVLEPA